MSEKNKAADQNATSAPLNRLDQVRLAIGFLTRLPIGDRPQGGTLADAAWAFPIVGLVVGAFGAAGFYGATFIGLPAWTNAFVAFAVMALVTGALHEDGLADVADGFGGGAVISRKLEIMRDSRIGSYGVLALVFSTGLKITALAAIGRVEIAVAVIVSAAIASRAVIPALMAALPMARDDGLAHRAGRPAQLIAGISLALGAAAILLLMQPHLVTTIGMGIAAVAGAALIGWLAKRQIGGQTGDVLGAAQQLSEALIILTTTAMLT